MCDFFENRLRQARHLCHIELSLPNVICSHCHTSIGSIGVLSRVQTMAVVKLDLLFEKIEFGFRSFHCKGFEPQARDVSCDYEVVKRALGMERPMSEGEWPENRRTPNQIHVV